MRRALLIFAFCLVPLFSVNATRNCEAAEGRNSTPFRHCEAAEGRRGNLLSPNASLVIARAQSARGNLPSDNADTSRYAAIDAKIDTYLRALAQASIEEKISEAEFLLSTCKTDSLRSHVAEKIYLYYFDSHVMGDESVAIHLTDDWFSTGRVKLSSEIERLNAKVFADFNRLSLIGCKAPLLRLFSPEGSVSYAPAASASSLGDTLFAPTHARPQVLYFYSPSCVKCRMESAFLKDFIITEKPDADFYLICTSDSKAQWDEYRSTKLNVPDAIHLWDPEITSDYQKKYGVIQTPRLFLIGCDGRIEGRGLDVAALRTLLAAEKLIYPSEGSERRFDGIFDALDNVSVDDVKSVARLISAKTGRTFRQMSGDYLYYLASRKEEAYKAGEEYVIDSLILGRPQIWCSADDSLKVIGPAMLFKSMLSKAPLGRRLPSIVLKGRFLKNSHLRAGKLNLSKPGHPVIVMFYSEGCSSCEAQRQALYRVDSALAVRRLPRARRALAMTDTAFAVRRVRALAMTDTALAKPSEGTSALAEKDLRVFLADMDALMSSDRRLAELLLDTFDLSSLPHLILIDQGGIVRRKYLSF